MRFLVTGGAGFIGSHLCERLVSRGHYVVALDDLSSGSLRNLSGLAGKKNFKFIRCDINGKNALKKVFSKKYECVFHLAANHDVRKGMSEPMLDFERTFLTTLNILEAMKKNGSRRLVFTSSSTVYGNLKGRAKESSPCIPISNYGAAKLASEAFISANSEKIDSAILRLPNVIGGRSGHGIIPDFAAKLKKNPRRLEILGNGKQSKEYLHVSDAVDAIVFCGMLKMNGCTVLNVSSSGHMSADSIARLLARKMRLSPVYSHTGGTSGWPGDVPNYSFDTSSMSKLGWKAKFSSREAVEKTIDELLGKL